MTTRDMSVLNKKLHTMGIPNDVLALIRSGLKAIERKIPAIKSDVQERMREVLAGNSSVTLTLSGNGSYRVFSPLGYMALCDSAKKHKPWQAAAAARNSKAKH